MPCVLYFMFKVDRSSARMMVSDWTLPLRMLHSL